MLTTTSPSRPVTVTGDRHLIAQLTGQPFGEPSDHPKQRTNRSADRAPWQSAATDRTINPMAQKGVGKRLSNAPRRRAY